MQGYYPGDGMMLVLTILQMTQVAFSVGVYWGIWRLLIAVANWVENRTLLMGRDGWKKPSA